MNTNIEAAHVLGNTLFVGSIAMVDLRLLGLAFRKVPVSQMNGRILPWTVVGFVLMAATGVALFYAIPVRTWHSVWFRAKLVLMLVAAVNIWIFHRRVERDRARWDSAERPPLGARISAAISLAAWIGVVVTGRMIAYNWFDCDKPQPPAVSALASCSTYPQDQ
jgi:peptidoglycan/LPS O-acetylase OafA/YrhL